MGDSDGEDAVETPGLPVEVSAFFLQYKPSARELQ